MHCCKVQGGLTDQDEADHLRSHTDGLHYFSGRSHRVAFREKPLRKVAAGDGPGDHEDPGHNVKNPALGVRKVVVEVGRQPGTDVKILKIVLLLLFNFFNQKKLVNAENDHKIGFQEKAIFSPKVP
jgi:hypothetical protein